MNFQNERIVPQEHDPADAAEDLKRRYEHAMALYQEEDFQAAASSLSGFGDALAECAAMEIVGTPVADPAASIVIVSYRHNRDVERCLEETSLQARACNAEIVLVDNGNEELFSAAEKLLKNYVAITMPFPAGVASGRNIGAHFSTASKIVFIDDDGIIEPRCVENLIRCLDETSAVGARGRVKPLTSPTLTAPHYDLGERRVPRLIDTEGNSIWLKNAFESAGGFDPLLYGHEGVELCCRLWRFYGPGAFLYEPSAILRHDFGGADIGSKLERHARARRYVEFICPEITSIHDTTQLSSADGRMLYLSSRIVEPPPASTAEDEPVSVITTARNAVEWIDEYCRSWKSQTQENFQLVFVDDGSGDGTPERVAELFCDDKRLTLIRKDYSGRGSSLNIALQHARHDICIVADVDDLSVPTRIARTQVFFRENPELDCVSFLAFTESNHFRAGPPYTPHVTDLEVRLLFGMPASFPAFAFRKSRFPEKFDEELRGGVDCDWLHRNVVGNGGLRGRIVHFPAVYYRQHDNQITRKYNEPQVVTRATMMKHAFSRVLGTLTEEDQRLLHLLVDKRKVAPAEARKLGDWVANFIKLNRERGVYDPETLEFAMLNAFDRVDRNSSLTARSGKAAAKASDALVEERVAMYRAQAEVHIANGQFKDARRALRNALKKQPDNAAVRRRLRAAHRYRIVRMIARSEPYVG